MKTKFTLISFTLIICLTYNIFAQDSKDRAAYRITEQDLIPEGITHSTTTNSFYISSIMKTKIVQIDTKTGNFKDFIPSDLVDMRFLGMITDDSRNHLWACGNNGDKSSVTKFNLKTGTLIKSFLETDTARNMFNDLVLDNEGNIYFTNSNKQTIYRIDHQTDEVSIFFDDDQISHPNGISFSPDYKYLFIASNDNGIRIIDIKKKEIINKVNDAINSKGIDGLKYYKNTLIGIQNAVGSRSEMKISQYFLDETGTKIIDMKIIDQDGPYFDIPTTFVIVGNELYCLANSQLANLSNTYEIRSYEALDDIIITNYTLD